MELWGKPAKWHPYCTVTDKPARSEQGPVKVVPPVGGAKHDDPLVLLETVHLGQQLVDGLVGVGVDLGAGSLGAHSVDLINENHAGGTHFGSIW